MSNWINKLTGGWRKAEGEDKKQFGSYGCSGYQQRVHRGGVATYYNRYRQHRVTSPSLSSSGNLLTCKFATDSRETAPMSVLTVMWRN